MRSLPPFDGLVAFDAVLRHGSATRAADALGLTQGAISHRLRRLEDWVGVPLLERQAGRLGPTAAGRALAAPLGEWLDGLAGIRARCRSAADSGCLKVAVGAALADLWLVRRLPMFASRAPGVEVELVVLRTDQDPRRLDADVHIAWTSDDRARDTPTQRRLFRESVFPVAAPRCLPDGRPLDDPASLVAMSRLHKGSRDTTTGAEWSWQTWFDRLGLGADTGPALRCDTIGTAIAAGLQGAGVVLARSLLVHDALDDGRLARVLAREWDMPSTKVHVARWQSAATREPRVAAFVEWLVAESNACGHGAVTRPA